jgi:hypothetical protein
MKLSDLPGYRDALLPSSSLPLGGCPEWDELYDAWLDRRVAAANERWLDSWYPHLPPKELITPFQLSNHLHWRIIGVRFPPKTGPTYNHRRRLCATFFHFDPASFEKEAKSYIDDLIAKEARDEK